MKEGRKRGFRFSFKRIGFAACLPHLDLSSSILTNPNLWTE